MRAESAVEPTRSENITVTWRRSAVSWASAPFGRRFRCCGRGPLKFADGREHLPSMPEGDTEVLQILIGQVGEYRDINLVLGKALSVLGHAELFEPVRNLLHRRHGHGANSSSKRLGLLQIERVEAFGEPAVDRSEKFAGLIPLALIAPEPRHAHRRAQFPGFCLLLHAQPRARARNTLPLSPRPAPATSARFPRPCD